MSSRHNIDKPKIWSKPRIKVYDINRMASEYYYQPMIEYIDKKEYCGFERTLPVHLVTLLSREQIKLPSADEITKARIEDLVSGAPRVGDFLAKYRARQIKEQNAQTIRTKNEVARQSRSAETIKDKRTSTLIRDQYIRELSAMNQALRS